MGREEERGGAVAELYVLEGCPRAPGWTLADARCPITLLSSLLHPDPVSPGETSGASHGPGSIPRHPSRVLHASSPPGSLLVDAALAREWVLLFLG